MKLRSAPKPPHGVPELPSAETAASAPFEPPPSTEVARIRRHQRAAQLAFDAYLARKTLEDKYTQPSFELHEDNDFAFFAVMRDGETAAIAFRGTKPCLISNWLADANCLLTGTPKRHRGFMSVWELLKPAVLRWLDAQRPLRIVLSGHSLGGALAVLAAYDLAADWTIEEVTVFGCPRAGTHGFASDYASRKCGPDTSLGDATTRYVHSTDVISRIPPPLFWYKHVGQPIYVDEEGHRIYYPLPYFMRVLDTALDPTAFPTSGNDYKTIRSSTQIQQPDTSVLSNVRRSVVPFLASGLIPLWAVAALVVALLSRFFLRDVSYFHDAGRYVNAIFKRQLLIERSPPWRQTQI